MHYIVKTYKFIYLVMYMRRAGMDWNDIIKITGHKNAVTLVKQYDLKLEAPGLHAASLAIGTGHKVAQGLEAPNGFT